MRFGIKDICIASFLGVLAGFNIIRVSRRRLDSIPFIHYVIGLIGIAAVLAIVALIRPLIKQEKAPNDVRS